MEKNWSKKFWNKFPSLINLHLKLPMFRNRSREIKEQKKPFIIPSRFGFYFGVGLFVLFILAYTYANQLIYLICFFYSSFIFISMYLVNNNLKPLHLAQFQISSFFLDEEGTMELTLKNLHKSRSLRFIEVSIKSFSLKKMIFEIKPQASETIYIKFKQIHRGQHPLPQITLFSTFPFGMFYTWKFLLWKSHYFTYPERKGSLLPPKITENYSLLKDHSSFLSSHLQAIQSDTFLTHKEYHFFENFRRIDWKASSRKNKLLVKVFEPENSGLIYIDMTQEFSYEKTEVEKIEKKLCQISAWISDIKKSNTPALIHFESESPLALNSLKNINTALEKIATYDLTF